MNIRPSADRGGKKADSSSKSRKAAPTPKSEVASPPKKLSVQERTRLANEEGRIRTGLRSFTVVGKALTSIRDGKLYREHSNTFEKYCAKCWDMSRQHAYRLIAAAPCYGKIKAGVSSETPLPITESQVRSIAGGLKETQWVDAWKRAVAKAKGSNPTAEQTNEVVLAILGKVPNSRTGPVRKKSRPPKRAIPLKAVVNLVASALRKENASVKDLREALMQIKAKLEALNQKGS